MNDKEFDAASIAEYMEKFGIRAVGVNGYPRIYNSGRVELEPPEAGGRVKHQYDSLDPDSRNN